jgi:simple sugar transport system ATP-binding protein
MVDTPRLELRGVTVRFGGLLANDHIDLSVAAGEIHGLLGENGAGKTTLLRVLAGLVRPQGGEILIDGAQVRLRSPLDAAKFGIGMVHQHFMLVPTLTVVQNLCLARDVGGIFPDIRAAKAALRRLSETFGLHVDPDARVGDLSVAGQQRVEVIKALQRGARILALDEPTAVLAPHEVDGLFAMLRALAAEGTAILFISHKLAEAKAIAERVTVLRRGRVVAASNISEASERELARMMIGEEVTFPRRGESAKGPVAVQIRDLSYRDERGLLKLSAVNLSVSAGEIVGLAGVDGNGQHELAEILVGLRDPTRGAILIEGEEVQSARVSRRIALGMAHIPEDRRRTALATEMSVAENAIMEVIGLPPYSRTGLVNAVAVDRFARDLIKANDVRCVGPEQKVEQLSGGNQQKLILGRVLARGPRFIVAVQPTRGLDIGATAFVQRELMARRTAGAAVLLISTEMDEILALADRVAVFFSGRIVGDLGRAEANRDRLGLMMTGQAA